MNSSLKYPKLRRFIEILKLHPELNKLIVKRKFAGTYRIESKTLKGIYHIYTDKLFESYIVGFVPDLYKDHVEILTVESDLKVASRKARHQARRI